MENILNSQRYLALKKIQRFKKEVFFFRLGEMTGVVSKVYFIFFFLCSLSTSSAGCHERDLVLTSLADRDEILGWCSKLRISHKL